MKTHISLNVSDIERSVEFYRKMFGVEPFKHKIDYAKFDIADPPLNLTMNRAPFERGGSLSHLGLQVDATDAVLAMREKWLANGLATIDEMETDCCYALQNKIWTIDPDGNSWEVFVVLADAPERVASGSECCVAAPNLVSIKR